jgi:hypothetical protein
VHGASIGGGVGWAERLGCSTMARRLSRACLALAFPIEASLVPVGLYPRYPLEAGALTDLHAAGCALAVGGLCCAAAVWLGRRLAAGPSPAALRRASADSGDDDGSESFLRVDWVAVPKALRARRVNRRR